MASGYMNADPSTDPDAARYAKALAAQMTRWLSEPAANPTTHASSDLIEWCRSARDVLERIGTDAP